MQEARSKSAEMLIHKPGNVVASGFKSAGNPRCASELM
jgi:hypothetical protein